MPGVDGSSSYFRVKVECKKGEVRLERNLGPLLNKYFSSEKQALPAATPWPLLLLINNSLSLFSWAFHTPPLHGWAKWHVFYDLCAPLCPNNEVGIICFAQRNLFLHQDSKCFVSGRTGDLGSWLSLNRPTPLK